jgi:FAD/FMN-containing dehydrogenase
VARFEQDARGGAGKAAAVLLPSTTNQVSQAVAFAVANAIRLVPQGANTGLTAAGLPDASGGQCVLSLDRMRDAPSIDVENRSASVAAGVRLSELNSAAQSFGLTFPIDLGADPSVGGMVAANTGGARFIRYGDVRRNVLGLEVVLADRSGTVLDLTSAQWKNNTGLDLKQLFIGSNGAMGVVTRAVLALHSAPRGRVSAILTPSSDDALIQALLTLERGFGPLLTAFEGMSGNAMKAALDHLPRLRNPFPREILPPYAVMVEISDPFDDEEAMLARLHQVLGPLLEGDDPKLADVLIGDPDLLWRLRHAITEGLKASGQVIACDIALRRGLIPRFRRVMTAEIARRWPMLCVCDFGHIGDGGLHYNLVVPASEGDWDATMVEAVKAAVFAAVVEVFGGSFSAEHGLGPRNATYYREYVPAATRHAAGRIQAVLNSGYLGRVSLRDGGETW